MAKIVFDFPSSIKQETQDKIKKMILDGAVCECDDHTHDACRVECDSACQA